MAQVEYRRRPSIGILPVPTSRRDALGQQELQLSPEDYNDTVNEIRARVTEWRAADYRGATSASRRLLRHWSDERNEPRLFFAQVEALETLIWLAEAAHADSRRSGRIVGCFDTPQIRTTAGVRFETSLTDRYPQSEAETTRRSELNAAAATTRCTCWWNAKARPTTCRKPKPTTSATGGSPQWRNPRKPRRGCVSGISWNWPAWKTSEPTSTGSSNKPDRKDEQRCPDESYRPIPTLVDMV